MKSEIHPAYHPVVFVDLATGTEFPTRSTMTSEERRDIDGIEYYVVRVDVSAASHPFFTGEQRIVDTAGRVERFRRRYARAEGAAQSEAETPSSDAGTAESE